MIIDLKGAITILVGPRKKPVWDRQVSNPPTDGLWVVHPVKELDRVVFVRPLARVWMAIEGKECNIGGILDFILFPDTAVWKKVRPETITAEICGQFWPADCKGRCNRFGVAYTPSGIYRSENGLVEVEVSLYRDPENIRYLDWEEKPKPRLTRPVELTLMVNQTKVWGFTWSGLQDREALEASICEAAGVSRIFNPKSPTAHRYANAAVASGRKGAMAVMRAAGL